MKKLVLALACWMSLGASEPIRKEKTRSSVTYTKAITQNNIRREYVVSCSGGIYQGKLYTFAKQLQATPPEQWLPDAQQYFKQFEREYRAENESKV